MKENNKKVIVRVVAILMALGMILTFVLSLTQFN